MRNMCAIDSLQYLWALLEREKYFNSEKVNLKSLSQKHVSLDTKQLLLYEMQWKIDTLTKNC